MNEKYLNLNPCKCNKEHIMPVKRVVCRSGAIEEIVSEAKSFSAKKAYVVSDINTHSVAGEKVIELLRNGGIEVVSFVYQEKRVEPDERAVGSAFMHFSADCDIIVGVGSGVINDICKLVAKLTRLPHICVATAPSMDGYASATSSTVRDGLKISLDSKCPEVIIGDLDILKTAPDDMLKAGLGDMLAKYISICEWRIGNLILGEYYCEAVADMVREALSLIVRNARKLFERDDEGIKAVFEGLVLSGIAMAYTGLSRPASGIEHYFSHLWDMRALSLNTNFDLHGVQCAVGTLASMRVYERLKKMTPNREKALKSVKAFSYEEWENTLNSLLGASALPVIEMEKKEQKYDLAKHAFRLETIIDKWDEIVKIIEEELPSLSEIEAFYREFSLPTSPAELVIECDYYTIFKATKDVRDKYILSKLAWDLGVLDEFKDVFA